MAKQCPHCGSYKTEISISRNVLYGGIQVGRVALAAAAYVRGALRNKGGLYSVENWESTEVKNFERHKCRNCGKVF